MVTGALGLQFCWDYRALGLQVRWAEVTGALGLQVHWAGVTGALGLQMCWDNWSVPSPLVAF